MMAGGEKNHGTKGGMEEEMDPPGLDSLATAPRTKARTSLQRSTNMMIQHWHEEKGPWNMSFSVDSWNMSAVPKRDHARVTRHGLQDSVWNILAGAHLWTAKKSPTPKTETAKAAVTFYFNIIMAISTENTRNAFKTHGFEIFVTIGLFNLIMEDLVENQVANNMNAQEIADNNTSEIMAIFVENETK